MEELINMAINLHLIFIVAMILLGLLNLFFIYSSNDFVLFTKKVKFVSPQYYMMLASIFFTGLMVLGVLKFTFTFDMLLMCIAWLIIFITSIKSFKIYKKTHPKDEIAKEAYKKFALKKYMLDVALLSFVSLFTYIW